MGGSVGWKRAESSGWGKAPKGSSVYTSSSSSGSGGNPFNLNDTNDSNERYERSDIGYGGSSNSSSGVGGVIDINNEHNFLPHEIYRIQALHWLLLEEGWVCELLCEGNRLMSGE